MKKRIIWLFSVLLLLSIASFALAYSFGGTVHADKQEETKLEVKTTAIGANATGSVQNITASFGAPGFQLRVVKKDGVQASNNTTVNKIQSFSMSYMLDGNKQSLGRKGYEYRMRFWNRTTAICTIAGQWYP